MEKEEEAVAALAAAAAVGRAGCRVAALAAGTAREVAGDVAAAGRGSTTSTTSVRNSENTLGREKRCMLMDGKIFPHLKV